MFAVKEFHRSKTGNTESEYEDSFAYDDANGIFAIADGATESSFADVWADALVSTFVEKPPEFDRNDRELMKDILKRARTKWYSGIDWESLPWFQKNKAFMGSYSTLLGLQIEMDGDKNRFRCITVGDSCMFQISGMKMESFPFADGTDMSNTPRLMWSGHGNQNGMEKDVEIPGIEVKYGVLRKGDTLMLATDALSKWILTHKSERPWQTLTEHESDFETYIGGLIAEGKIKNDDITLLVISTS